MPVALPPPLPPQPGEVLAQSRAHPLAVLQFQQYRVHLLGERILDANEAAAALRGADTLSNAVRRLAAACYAAGYPTAQLRYALEGDDLYVLVVAVPMVDARVSPPLAPYFHELQRMPLLSDRELEPRRLLAGIHADRAGIDAQLGLQPRGDGYLLTLDSTAPRSSATQAGIGVSNPGNRYVGRYFSDLSLRHDRASGDEYGLAWRHGLVALDDDAQASAYDEAALSFSRVTPRGLFGLAGQHVDYRQRLPDRGDEADGRLQQLAASWLAPLAAGFRERWTVNLRLDYTRQRLDVPENAPWRQDYTSAEAGTVLGRQLFGWQLDAGLQLRQGLGGSGDGSARLDYRVLRPKLRLRREFGDIETTMEMRGQWSADAVPEQSQWLLGGADHLSAWLPGVVVGDRGWIAQASAACPLPSAGPLALRGRLFAEYGRSRLAESDTTEAALGDAGAGLALKYRQSLEADLSYARPLHAEGLAREQREEAEAGLLFRASWKF